MSDSAALTANDRKLENQRRFAAVVSLGVGVLMLVGKWAAYWLTGSHAILSDALESVVHIAATTLALVSLIVASRPPDPKYPYGYGKIGFFSAGFEGGLISVAALAIFWEAGRGFYAPEPLRNLDAGFLLILAASFINLALGLWLVARGRRTNSMILIADGRHVLTDSYTSFGVVVGVLLVRLTGWYVLDPSIALLVGLNIIRTGSSLVREAFSGLMDRSDPELLGRIVEALRECRESGWLDVHQLRAWQSGDRVHVDFHMVVPRSWTVCQLHESHDAARDRLKTALGPRTETIIHFDPAGDPGETTKDWTLDSAVRVPSRDDPAAVVAEA